MSFKRIKKKQVYIQQYNYGAKRIKQAIFRSLKIIEALSSLQSCLIYIKLCQFGFSSHNGF